MATTYMDVPSRSRKTAKTISLQGTRTGSWDSKRGSLSVGFYFIFLEREREREREREEERTRKRTREKKKRSA